MTTRFRTMKFVLPVVILLSGLRAAHAVSPDVPSVSATPVPAPAPPPPPYSLPWQLRPAQAVSVVRWDNSIASYETPTGLGGSTVASTLLASYKVTPDLAPLLRLGFVQNQEPGPMLDGGSAFVNPIVGLTYGRKLGGAFRGAGFAGVTVPLGSGGDKSRMMNADAAAVFRGIAARSAMDNAMFAVNYFTMIAGADVAYVAHKLTVQAEVTLLQLQRVRNENIDVDSSRTNLTAGLHAGYFLLPFLSLAGEVRYQRWLSTPAAVKMNPDARETVTMAIGPRFHIKVGDLWVRPGLSYSTAVDKPVSDLNYHIVQVDVPVIF